jgi:1-acyl-sn-glycerol-3-phosphate acyltransferase
VFPEGRINTGLGLLDANPGVAFLALKSRVPVYPVFIHNSPQANSMVECFYTASRVRVVYGDPIDLSEFYDQRTTHELLQHVTDLLMHRLAELGGLTVADAGRDDRSDLRTLRLRTG